MEHKREERRSKAADRIGRKEVWVDMKEVLTKLPVCFDTSKPDQLWMRYFLLEPASKMFLQPLWKEYHELAKSQSDLPDDKLLSLRLIL